MTAPTSAAPPAPLPVPTAAAGTRAGSAAGARVAVRSLARLEAVRNLRAAPLWVGLLACALMAPTMSADWQSGVYGLFATWFIPLVVATFVAGIRSGSRDRHVSAPPLAEEAALGPSQRAAARLLGMLPLVGIGTVAVIAVAVGIRIEGGHWVGDAPGRTDAAVHTLPEVLQPVVLLALAAALGVAAGGAVRRTAPVLVLGVATWLVFGMVTWPWQWAPARYLTPVQVQPILQTIGPAELDPATFPTSWRLEAPGEHHTTWDRVIVHQPMAAWHDAYLGGLALAAVGLAVRGTGGRRALVAGAVTVALAVAAQVAVAPPASVGPLAATTQAAP